MDEWVLELGAQLDHPDIDHPPDPFPVVTEMPSIFGNWQCWEDFEVSFLSETKKRQFVAYMRRWFGLDVRRYLEYMQDKVDLAWSYYGGVNEQLRAENYRRRFIEHLLGISCFLLFAMIIFKDEGGRLWSKLSGDAPSQTDRYNQFYNLFNLIKNSEPMLIESYLLTMDYQIPWFVVEAVYTDCSNLKVDVDTPILELALSCFDKVYPGVLTTEVQGGTFPQYGFKHLLHIFHWSRSRQGKFILTRPRSWPLEKMDSFYIPSATELHLSEIGFEKHAHGSIDLEYSESSGVMKLAHWNILPYSIKLYESILRFECNYHDCGFPFTAYVACMVCLLQTKEDVRLLRDNDIVPSTTNDESDVLRSVQEFKRLLRDDIRVTDDLHNLSVEVRERHASKSIRCYGEFKSNYCPNPWIAISVAGVFLIFVLTFIQTVLSFIQTI